jgi:hypothetical protein
MLEPAAGSANVEDVVVHPLETVWYPLQLAAVASGP